MHCYYNAVYSYLQKPVNYNDFTFFDFQIVCEDWSKIIFERPIDDFKLSTNFEVGLNIELGQYSPWDVIARYMSYATTTINEFYTCPPAGLKGKPIQRMCYMSDYKLKVYDKSKQAQISKQGLLRYEIIYTELRKIQQVLGSNKEVITMKSLNNLDTWNTLFTRLIEMYDAINKIPLITNLFSIEDVNSLHGYCNKIMADDIKSTMNINTYGKKRADLKNLYRHYNEISTNYHQMVRIKLINKFNSIISLQQFQTV